jgi:hypothetical protein
VGATGWATGVLKATALEGNSADLDVCVVGRPPAQLVLMTSLAHVPQRPSRVWRAAYGAPRMAPEGALETAITTGSCCYSMFAQRPCASGVARSLSSWRSSTVALTSAQALLQKGGSLSVVAAATAAFGYRRGSSSVASLSPKAELSARLVVCRVAQSEG